jgi:2'-5' RNA ligase
MENNVNSYLYVCCNISGEAANHIQSLRNKYDSFTAQLPVEITIIGSSGIGPILKNEPAEIIKYEFIRAASGVQSFGFTFQEIDNFQSTMVYYLKPNNREYFDELHNNFKKMKLVFAPNKFPYNPHCTISCNPNLSEKQQSEIKNEIYFKEIIRIESISLYEFAAEPFTCNKIETYELQK